MVAGRHDVSKRSGLDTYSKYEYDRYRNSSRVLESTRGCDQRTNGYHSSSRTGNLGGDGDSSQRGGFLVLAEDQELVASGSRVEEGKIVKSTVGVKFAFEKKRRFSPIVWDRQEKEVRILSKNRIVQCCDSASPSSPPKSASIVSDGSVQIDPFTVDPPQGMKISQLIHKQEFPYAILAKVVRNAEKRNGSNNGLTNQNLELELLDFVFVIIVLCSEGFIGF